MTRTETLILTNGIAQDAYRDGNVGVPPYLAAGAAAVWTADYPQEFGLD